MEIISFRDIYKDLLHRGHKVSPRGEEVIEIENASYIFTPFQRFINFECRKLSVPYIKKEFLWYLKGDRFDNSICKYASFWKTIQNKDGSFNSNYGQYIFGIENQFDIVLNILKKDKDSRRASIIILKPEHINSDTKDVCCTYAINFRIREDILNMTVHMRSNDAIFGLGNDLPCFSFIFEMMYNTLKEFYPSLEQGLYYHNVDSFHVYARHYEMLEKIANKDELEQVNCPKISGSKEVKFLRTLDFDGIPLEYHFIKWLTN